MDLSIHALGKDEGPAFWFLNTLAVLKATAKQTGNAFLNAHLPNKLRDQRTSEARLADSHRA